MIQNYLKIVLRNLSRNKFYFTVNVMGLGIALGCCIIAFLNYTYDRDFDTMHENAAQIYRVTSIKASNGREYGFSPIPLSITAKQDIAEIDKTLNWTPTGMTIKSGDQVFGENVHFATSEVNEFFTFPVLYGSLTALDNPSQVVITQEKAIKFFGTENCIGKTITLYSGEDSQLSLIHI